MNTEPAHMDRAALLELASDPERTPFDYIVVGSGAGGGPLAARLALGHKRVLVLEAGADPALPVGDDEPAVNGKREVYVVPAYHAAATEYRPISWDFSVRHYEEDEKQRRDSKYDGSYDPSTGKGTGKGGIQYPRVSALGGCTAHHAMIVIRPNDRDWDRIAEFTEDPSWRSENMQGYFAKIENCLYYTVYRGFLGKILGGLLYAVQWTATLINPRRQLDPGGHGFKGWQPTSFIDPLVVAGIAIRDRTFLSLLRDVIFSALAKKDERSLIRRAFSHLQIIQFLDPNVRSPEIPTRTHLSLISIGTDGIRRSGLREHLLDVAEKNPDKLILMTGVHATRVLFAKEAYATTPRAIGVEIAEGAHLYRASPVSSKATTEPSLRQFFARQEVIVCGGSFNSPQLLMLSGIGETARLHEHGINGLCNRAGEVIAPVIHLPGVGCNLQDRYEVSVISESKTDFSTLKGVSFVPGDVNDTARKQWLKDGTGLYSINGGALAMMMSSEANKARSPDPDLFIFGVPAAFRGYYWGWSKELLRRLKGDKADVANLWSWVILKAYTRNNRGTVRLRSADPFDTPDINFHSFSEGPPEFVEDVDALCGAVKAIRAINCTVKTFKNEVQPGSSRPNDSPALVNWVQDEAWGHHACGTCRMGFDKWQDDVNKLEDRNAVLDSKFRVHGVRGLRVVDASVFRDIPGYFIVTPVFMIGEKAADTLLADSEKYPDELERREAESIRARRKIARCDTPATTEPALAKLPDDTVGLALSGGGIRSATFCLGVLQALAAGDRLRRIDILSGVSGGGYIAGFLGRLYTRVSDRVADRVKHIGNILANTDSPEIWWLRRNADYIGAAGRIDLESNLAIYVRNLATVHLCVGATLFGLFGLLCALGTIYLGDFKLVWRPLGVEISLWWWLPFAVLFAAVLPLAIAYWLSPTTSARRPYPAVTVILWFVLLSSAVYGLGVAGATLLSGVAIVVLLLAWITQEIARWKIASSPGATLAWGSPGTASADDAAAVPPSTVVRNRLTRALGTMILALVVSIAWVVLDTLAHLATTPTMMPFSGWSMIALGLLLPLLRNVAVSLIGTALRAPGTPAAASAYPSVIVGGLAFVLAALLLFYLDFLAHAAFGVSFTVGIWAVVTALIGSVVVGRAFALLNLSSLQQSYSQKLVRTFLGATADDRVHPTGTDAPVPIEIPSADDDVAFSAYHPEQNGGPLHLVNVCVNDTVDRVSGRQLQKDKGLPMCVGPVGVSVGLRYHARWDSPKPPPTGNELPIIPLAIAPDPNRFHVLVRKDVKPVVVEQLKLGQWMAISGASFTTGAGRNTKLSQSLLLGLLNVRLGYWWNSGIDADQRPGRYPPNLWRWLKALPAALFRVQASLLNEWRAYFAGPAARLWYLSDGGHFDNTGLYELIRRRLPFIIAVDGAQDDRYQFEDLAILTRQVRLDFKAELAWIDPTVARATGGHGWPPLDGAPPLPPVPVPLWIRQFFDPDAIGALSDLKREAKHCAALARVTYADDADKITWLLLLKANLAPALPTDVRNYATTHPTFPNQSTLNQFFDDDQWESYRNLGEAAGRTVFQ